MIDRFPRSKGLLLLAAVVLALGCARGEHKAAAVKDMAVPQLAELLKAGSAAVFDANTDGFRAQNGIIPGAVLLASSSSYPLSVLPADKGRKLVFYCTGRL